MLFLIAIVQHQSPTMVQDPAIDLRPLGAKSARQVSFEIPRERYPFAHDYLGTKISLDGKILFSEEVRTPIIDIASGTLLWEERMRVGKVDKGSGWVVGTMSQWGHMHPSGSLQDASLQDMIDADHWLALSAPQNKDKSKSLIIANVLTDSRSIPPNQQIYFPPLRDWARPAHRGYFARFKDSSHIVFEALDKDPHGKWILRSNEWNLKSKKSPGIRTTIRKVFSKSDQNFSPIAVDSLNRRILYFNQKKGQYTEGSLSTNKLFEFDDRNSDLHYWRGKLVSMPGRDKEEKRGIYLYSDDRKTKQLLGQYSWFASSSNDRFALIKKQSDNSFWLVDFGT